MKPYSRKSYSYTELVDRIRNRAVSPRSTDPLTSIFSALDSLRKELADRTSAEKERDGGSLSLTPIIEIVNVDLSLPIEVQIYLDASDRFTIVKVEPSDKPITPKFVDGKGKLTKLSTLPGGSKNGEYFFPDGKAGRVRPIFFKGDTADAEELREGTIKLRVSKTTETFLSRGIGVAIGGTVSTSVASEASPVKNGPKLVPPEPEPCPKPSPPKPPDLCDALRANPPKWDCAQTKAGRYLLRPLTSVGDPKVFAKQIEPFAKALAEAMTAAKVDNSILIRGYASKKPISCRKALGRVGPISIARNGKTLDCENPAPDLGNAILSAWRASLVGEGIQKQIPNIQLNLAACGSRYAAMGNSITDRSVVVELPYEGKGFTEPSNCDSVTINNSMRKP